MTDYPTIIFPEGFSINVKKTEKMPNNDVVTRILRRYPVPLRSSPFGMVEITYGPKRQVQLDEVRKLFWAMNATEHTFRIKDPQDFQSVDPQSSISNLDQNIGTGDGATATFQIRKDYGVGAAAKFRTVTNIIPGTQSVAVAGVAKTVTTHYTIDNVTGIITFTGGNIPTGGQAVTAGYQFYLKVRFADEDLMQQFDTHLHATIDSFMLELAE